MGPLTTRQVEKAFKKRLKDVIAENDKLKIENKKQKSLIQLLELEVKTLKNELSEYVRDFQRNNPPTTGEKED